MAEAAFEGVLDHRQFALPGVAMEVLPHCERVSLRARPQAIPALGASIGITLPARPKTSTEAQGVNALWLGPDEWLLFAPTSANLHARLGASNAGQFSAVDVSHRNAALAIWGRKAVLAINSGCPQDLSLSAFPVGACSRTLLGKSEVVLLRTDEEAFRVECWRSFADYVWNYLVDAAKSA